MRTRFSSHESVLYNNNNKWVIIKHPRDATMLRLNDVNFRYDGSPRRFGKTNSIKSKSDNVMDQVQVEFFTPTSDSDWRPIKLINDSIGVAYTIPEKLRWVDIARNLLKDGTNSSNIAKLVRGECKRVNGWRCEFLD
jgi:hypothetical protein